MSKLSLINPIADYASFSELVNCPPELRKTAKDLTKDSKDSIEKAKILFEFVRDKIAHSFDIQNTKVTSRASDVIKNGHGICFAKSHLLAALCRSVEIPAGLCYQKLIFDDQMVERFFTLHGFNAVYLAPLKRWVRLDARGNKLGVTAEFDLEKEKLAFPTRVELGEADYPTIFSQPHPSIVQSLTQLNHWDFGQINRQLPENL